MKVVRIESKNFRAFQDIEIVFSENYVTISGKNNAGKSTIIKVLTWLLERNAPIWYSAKNSVSYKDDKTQWQKNNDPIEISYSFSFSKSEDPALVSFVEKIASASIEEERNKLEIFYNIDSSEEIKCLVKINGNSVDEKATKEIERRIKDSNLLFVHNSTQHEDDFLFSEGKRRVFFDFVISPAERKTLDDANKTIERQIRKLAKEHVSGLTEILGKLAEKYDVELSPPERTSSRRMPLGINLKDKTVDMPIDEWGSGTQNRTHILMAVLRANKIKTTDSVNEKITPIVLIEEPESFLHPSAQAEFGRVLKSLSDEFGIQIIVTTHSPYMLNQADPSSNILLSRRQRRGKLTESFVVELNNKNWMAPFSEHLGISNQEFEHVKSIFGSGNTKSLLVEGPIDKDYFDYFKTLGGNCERLDSQIEVTAYGGKDTLKNTVLIKFVLSKFDKVFISFDLDAEHECKTALTRAKVESSSFCPIGISSPGKDCIEGILPVRVLAEVNGEETDLVMQLGSNSDRKRAKDALKKKYLECFKKYDNYSATELSHINAVIKKINSHLNQ